MDYSWNTLWDLIHVLKVNVRGRVTYVFDSFEDLVIDKKILNGPISHCGIQDAQECKHFLVT
jgi:hypothetical protein